MFKGDDSHFVKNHTSDDDTTTVKQPISIDSVTTNNEPSTVIFDEFTNDNERETEIGSTRSDGVFEDSINTGDVDEENEITTNNIEHVVTSDDELRKTSTVSNLIVTDDNIFENTAQFFEPKTTVKVTTLYTRNSETTDLDGSVKTTLTITTVNTPTSNTENTVNSRDQIDNSVNNSVQPENAIETSTYNPDFHLPSVNIPDDNAHDVSTVTENVIRKTQNVRTTKLPEYLIETTTSNSGGLSSATTIANSFPTSDTVDGLTRDTDMITENTNRDLNSVEMTTSRDNVGNDGTTTLSHDNADIETTSAMSDSDNVNASTDGSTSIIRSESTEGPYSKTFETPASSTPNDDIRPSSTTYEEATTGNFKDPMDSRTIQSDEENEIKNNDDALITTRSYLDINTVDNGHEDNISSTDGLRFKTFETTTTATESNNVDSIDDSVVATTTSSEMRQTSRTTANNREDALLQVASNEPTVSSDDVTTATRFNADKEETTANTNAIASTNSYVDTGRETENDGGAFTTKNWANVDFDVFAERTTELFNVEKGIPGTTATNRVTSSTVEDQTRTNHGQLLDDNTSAAVSETVNDIDGPTTTSGTEYVTLNNEIDGKTTTGRFGFEPSSYATTTPIESNDVTLDFTNNVVTTTSNEFPQMSEATINSREDASLQVTLKKSTVSSDERDNVASTTTTTITTRFNDEGEETTTNANFKTITSINLYVDNGNDDRVVFTTKNWANDFDVFAERTTELFNVEKGASRATTTNRPFASTTDAEIQTTGGTDGQYLRTSTVVSETINDTVGTEGPPTTTSTSAKFVTFDNETDGKTTTSSATRFNQWTGENAVQSVTTDAIDTVITVTAPDQVTYDLVNRPLNSTEPRDEGTSVEPETTVRSINKSAGTTGDSNVSSPDVRDKWGTSLDEPVNVNPSAGERTTVVGTTGFTDGTTATERRPAGPYITGEIFTENYETTTGGSITDAANDGVEYDSATTTISSGAVIRARGKNESVITTPTQVADRDDTISASNGETSTTIAANEVIAGSGFVTRNGESIVSTRIPQTDKIETVGDPTTVTAERQQPTTSSGTINPFETTTVPVITTADWIIRKYTAVSPDEPVTGENVETRSDSSPTEWPSRVLSENIDVAIAADDPVDPSTKMDDVYQFETSSFPSLDDATAVINLMTTSIEVLVSRLSADDDSPTTTEHALFPTTSESTSTENVTATTTQESDTAQRYYPPTTTFVPTEETTFKHEPTTATNPETEQDTTDTNNNDKIPTTTEYIVTSKIVGIEDVTFKPKHHDDDDRKTNTVGRPLPPRNITSATRKRCWNDTDCDAGHKCLAAKCLPTGESHVNNCPPGIITLQCLNQGIIYT